MSATYKGVVRGSVVVLEGDPMLPEGTRVTIVPESAERSSLRFLSQEELRRRKEACERLGNNRYSCSRTGELRLHLAIPVMEPDKLFTTFGGS